MSTGAVTSRGEPPATVRALAALDGAEGELVWTNELGGQTFRVDDPGGARYLKWQPQAGLSAAQRAETDLAEEARRMRWAGAHIAVPTVLDVGTVDDGAWLLTTGVDADSPLTDRWLADPGTVVPAIARGLRRLHETLPVKACPFTCGWVDEAAGRRPAAPPPERLVVCHGDPCVPNTLLDDDGVAVAHVDLGDLGVADRWADLAIASWSVDWDINFGPGHQELFFAAYGIDPDWERISYYRRLWEDR